MPLVGVICPYDDSYQPFDVCINAHECGDGPRNCDAVVQILKIMRDNHKERMYAGWSASTLTQCARATALQEQYDYYEDVKSGYNKGRGTWVHAMIEADKYPRAGLIREQRLVRYLDVDGVRVRLTGKPDEVDTARKKLIDYKSKDRVPKEPDPKHEAQFNVYIWLLNDGAFVNEETGEEKGNVNVEILGGGMHYLTWNPKDPWKKMGYPVWPLEQTEAFIIERLTPLVAYDRTKELPRCNAYLRYGPKWRCDCVKLEEQLRELGTYVE